MKSKNLIIIIFFFCMAKSAYPQFGWGSNYDPNDVIGNQLYNTIKSEFGMNNTVNYYVIDSLFNKPWIFGDIVDPYNTLSGKVLFISYPLYKQEDGFYSRPDSSIIGLFENNRIIWHSDYISFAKIDTATYGEFYDYSVLPDLFSISDINRDGKVDILIMAAGLWIVSWDGTNGTIINDMDLSDRSSKLISSDSYDLIDTNGDDILEILSYWFEYDSNKTVFPPIYVSTKPYVTYGWNGSKYGLWSNVVQVGFNTFLPANKLAGEVKCNIKKDINSDSLIYNYSVQSQSNSKQRVVEFVLDNLTEEKTISVNDDLWAINTFDSSGVSWYTVWQNVSIKPGDTKAGFSLKSQIGPQIISFYLRADGHRIAYGPDLDRINSVDLIENIRVNSFSNFTIGPMDIDANITPLNFIDTLLNLNQRSFELGWVTNQSTADKYASYFNIAKTQLQQNNISAVRDILNQVLQDVNADSSGNLTSEAYALLRYNTEYLLANLPQQQNPNLLVKLTNSQGATLTTGTLQYYEGSWKNAAGNGDGTFTVTTNINTVSLRMNYEYGSQTVSNITAHNNTYTFQTVSAQAQLQNSSGSPIDTGIVQYYAGAWRDLGVTSNGVTSKELLPGTYSFRMTYAGGSNDKQQNIGTNATVVFQTVNAFVELRNSANALMDQGTVQYYAGSWRDIGAATNGTVSKELLPNNYSFRMSYAGGSNDKQQNIGTNATVVFQTVTAIVELRNSANALIDQGTVQYYAGSWRSFGTTSNGTASKELLPNNYSFRMNYEFVSNDKQQNIATNSTVIFSTVLCTIRVKNSQSQPLNNAAIKYYAGAWRTIGNTVNGEITKELLPANIPFRANYGTAQQDKTVNLSSTNLVEFIFP